MTRLKIAVIAVAIAIAALGGGIAWAAVTGAPPVTSPTPTTGPYFSGPVHQCISDADESTLYTETRSDRLGNCASGYTQLVANELTPAFTLQLGSVTYACTADTAQPQTAITCPTPSASPSG
jgi:hypothetical protein